MSYVSGYVYSGETSVSTTAVAVSTTAPNCREALIQSDPDNTTVMLVGDGSSQEIKLSPGQSITLPIISLSRVFIKMVSGTGTANWLIRD